MPPSVFGGSGENSPDAGVGLHSPTFKINKIPAFQHQNQPDAHNSSTPTNQKSSLKNQIAHQ